MLVQLPGDALNTTPTCAAPEIDGTTVFTGTGICATTPVCTDETGPAVPPAFDAETFTLTVEPASPPTGV